MVSVGTSGTGPPRSPQQVCDWVTQWLRRRLGGDAVIDTEQTFAFHGLTSRDAVSMVSELETWLGTQLSPTLPWQVPTIRAFATAAAAPGAATMAIADQVTPQTDDEPIAIVGIGCRFPGCNGLAEFWELLLSGRDAVTARYPWRSRQKRDRSLVDDGAAWPGGWLDDPFGFDNAFFGIGPREAAGMDPQQRLLLEVSWEALEDGGIVPDRIAGMRGAVMIGLSSHEYLMHRLSRDAGPDAYAGTDVAGSIAANRLSYFYDLHGPSLTIDTACSSSLVAVHEACEALRRGEADIAIAGGVNLLQSHELFESFSAAGFLSPRGRCQTFDAGADGYVRAEGAGIVVLKTQTEALRSGDRIRALILGGAVVQDGRSNGLTAPRQTAQEAVLRDAWRRAGIDPAEADYIEAHGTGTALGDPIETAALDTVFGQKRDRSDRLLVGSVKTNTGHLESAAGVAGLIKLALTLEHGTVPPNLHFSKPNPLIDFASGRFGVPVRVENLAADEHRKGGVSSFGFGGTNAHLVLRSGDAAVQVRAPLLRGGAQILPVSAQHPEALTDLVARWQVALRSSASEALAALCQTAAVHRSHGKLRVAAVGASAPELATALAGALADPVAQTAERLSICMVFTGQGGQWFGMARRYYDTWPVFRETLLECADLLASHEMDVLPDLIGHCGAPDRMDRTDVAQASIFALQVSLSALWRSWGIEPDAVIGHSVGEVAAAVTAGALSLHSGVELIIRRGNAMQAAGAAGAMAVVNLPSADLGADLQDIGIGIAALNSPGQTVISGPRDAVQSAVERFVGAGHNVIVLPGAIAFHSSLMTPAQEALRTSPCLWPADGSVPLYSTKTGGQVSGHELAPEYWADQVVAPIRFAGAMRCALAAGADTFIELGPRPDLQGAMARCAAAENREIKIGASLAQSDQPERAILETVTGIYSAGAAIDWSAVCGRGSPSAEAPRYAWRRPGAVALATRSRTEVRGLAGLKGRWSKTAQASSSACGQDWVWEVALRSDASAVLAEHRVGGVATMPLALYLQVATDAARQTLGFAGRPGIEALELLEALSVRDDEVRSVQIRVTRNMSGEAGFRISSRATGGRTEAPWVLHARGDFAVSCDGSDCEKSCVSD